MTAALRSPAATVCGLLLFSSVIVGMAAAPSVQAGPAAAWIWAKQESRQQRVWLRRTVTIDSPLESARLACTCDNRFTLFVNGQQALSGANWSRLEAAEVGHLLRLGENVLAVEALNEGGPAGFVARLHVVQRSGEVIDLVTDGSWKCSPAAAGRWQDLDFDDASWPPARVIGPAGGDKLPWSRSIDGGAIAAALVAGASGDYQPQPAASLSALAGFQVEKIFDVPREMGSWVSLAVDDRGRLVASDQGEAGLFLVTPGRIGDSDSRTVVEKLPVKLSSAQGLLQTDGALYAVAGGRDPGLHRLTDSDGDGLVDTSEYLMRVPGGGEHGPHGIVLSPDGRSLYVACGNHTDLPDEICGSRIARNWGEDHLLPRRWDANGHAAGRLAPGGWICRVDLSGKLWEVFSIGYRNQYDIAFNADGELFTYDADMEWDFGSPWYRPTRVCHATSGSEFGWRSGTGKWPVYYEDSLPPVVDIGPGSPTGVVFGYGARFPARYQRALFILDWTYSTIYAVHLVPEGASYRAEKEDFVTGSPLSVTDAVVGRDGALYFAVGGRGTQSALYRVTYTGDEPTEPVDARDPRAADLRQVRRRLEAWHGRTDGDLDFIFAHLDHPDRFIRYAARAALEWQPLRAWRSRALAPTSSRASLTALMALARQGRPDDLEAVLAALERIELAALDEPEQLTLMRVYALAFIRLGEPGPAWRQRLAAKFDACYPSASERLNAELVQLLVYLGSPGVVEKTLTLIQRLGPEPPPDWGHLIERNANYGGTVARMLEDMPPVRGIHYAFVLRNVEQGWTLDQRRRYLSFFIEAARHPGGASYPGFLSQMREDALAACSPAERLALDDVAGASLMGGLAEVRPPKGPGRKWTRDEALAVLAAPLRGRSYERGRNLYHATNCAKCHRYNAEGGAIGPDLSTAGRKFALPDLLDAIIEPSKAISDQFGSHQVVTADGQTLLGRVVEIGDALHVYTLDPDQPPRIFAKADVEELVVSNISQMPVGLIDPLNAEELKDLIAYLLSAGNKRAEVYRK